ncbi:endo-1,4-beta-xylanase [Clostridium estertheticum]|nr:endo-1,4-beta-xylanase [Clostridium estertheticum]MBZ9614045.1 endo-1,4-beta-xylanase [Clostridium estertheticum subsp. laramiense]WAG73998.1 endo-1,4-beta-xylanase [Clostridium estertheticum]
MMKVKSKFLKSFSFTMSLLMATGIGGIGVPTAFADPMQYPNMVSNRNFENDAIVGLAENKTTANTPTVQLNIQNNIPNLSEVFKDYFPIGTVVYPASILGSNSQTDQLIKKHFNTIVAGNDMKPDALQPTEGKFTYTKADKIVDYAIENKMAMRGHTLVWHSQIPDWFFQDPKDSTKLCSKDLLLKRLETHINTVLTHFKDKYGANNPIKCWDVVNEVIDNSGTYRDSKWYQIAGADYIEKAFEIAHKADPTMKLYINDYGIEGNTAKTQKMYDIVKDLKAKGVPVDGIGMQMHINTNTSVDSIKASIEKFASLGVDIQVTELDLEILGTINQEGYLKQAKLYKQVFDLLKSKKNNISTVMIWGITDADSWRSDYQPLLFDSKFQAKPAYWAIVDPSKVKPSRQSLSSAKGTPLIGPNIDKLWIMGQTDHANTFYKGMDGATANVKTLWDENNLYIYAQVTDATPKAKDSIEIFVDKNDGKTTNCNTGYKHYKMSRNNSESSSITHYVQNGANGYTVQAIIPLSDINPKIGSTIGYDIRVNDDKGKGSIDSIAELNDYSNSQDISTAYYGNLTLNKPSQAVSTVYGTPIIDGKIDDIWNKTNVINTNKWVNGTSGATAKVRTMWDNNNLYVLSEVTDDVLNKSSANAYEQDSVEIFLDQNDHKTSSYEKDDSQMRVNFDNEQSFGGAKPDGFKSATSRTQAGYIVEEVIPLTAIKPADGSTLGFDVQVNNADSKGKRISVAAWCDDSGSSFENTSKFGNIMLKDTRTITKLSAIAK